MYSTLTRSGPPPARPIDLSPDGRLLPGLLAVLMASGSVVFIEPAPYDLLAIILFLGLLAGGLRFPRGLQGPVLLLGLFVAANVVSALLSTDPLQTIRSLSIRIYMPMTFLLIAALIATRPAQLLPALWAGYLAAALLAVGWGTLEYLGLLPGELWQGGLRAKGGFKDPNVFGPFLVPAAVHAVRRIAGGRPRQMALYLPVFLVLAFGVLLSFSRGAWINGVVSLGLFALLTFVHASSLRQRIHWLLASVAMVAVAVATLTAAVSVESIGERFFQRAVLTQKYDIAAGGRFDAQSQALARIGADPVGVGPGRSDEEFGLEPHNLYLHVFVEAGWLGGVSFLMFLILTGVRLLPLLRLQRHPLQDEVFLVTACLTGVLLQSLFIDSTHWRHLWLLLGLAWGLSVACRRARRAPAISSFMSKRPAPAMATGYPATHSHAAATQNATQKRTSRQPSGPPLPGSPGHEQQQGDLQG